MGVAGTLAASVVRVSAAEERGRVAIDIPLGKITNSVIKNPSGGDKVEIFFVAAGVIADLDAMVTAVIGTLKKTTIAGVLHYQSDDAIPSAFVDVANEATIRAEADASFSTLL